MAEPNDTPIDPYRQARQHLEGLRAAGIEFVPDAEPPPATPAGPERPAVPAPSLFAATGADINRPEPERRQIELDTLAAEVAGCRACPELVMRRTNTVFGTGRIDPAVCFVGEAPGEQEDLSGEPFVGPAGQLLTRIIQASGLTREEVYICNIIKCRPPGNRNPNTQECRNCRAFLERQLELVNPPYIVALGRIAAHNLLGTSESLGRLRGRFHDHHGTPVMVTFHPSYLLRLQEPRRTEEKRKAWEDMKMLLRRMGREVPTPGSGRPNN